MNTPEAFVLASPVFVKLLEEFLQKAKAAKLAEREWLKDEPGNSADSTSDRYGHEIAMEKP